MENEDNVLVCLRIIIELHKQFRPPHSGEITHFLHFVQSIYKELPNRLNKVGVAWYIPSSRPITGLDYFCICHHQQQNTI